MAYASDARAATFVVASDLDDGSVGTLRWAITEANGAAGADVIEIPAITITLTSALPAISDAVEINGAGKNATFVQASAVFWDHSIDRRVLDVGSGAPTTLRDLAIRHGRVTDANGGGINAASALTMERVAVRKNVADSIFTIAGGGINASASVIATECDIEENVAISRGTSLGSDALGGGLVAFGTALTFERCTIADNQAVSAGMNPANGGGMLIFHGAGIPVIFRQCTISANRVANVDTGVARGAGISLNGAAGTSDTFDSCAITNNKATSSGGATEAGGLYWNLATDNTGPVLRNCIVYGNEAATGPDLRNNIQSRGFNIVGSLAGATWDVAGGAGNTAEGNQIGVDPLLRGLGYYGGETRTHRLLAGSPALDLGTDLDVAGVAFTTDQRGRPRVSNGAADIGPFELDQVAPTVAGGIALDPTTTTDRDAVVFHVTFDETLASALTSANVALTGTLAGAAAVSVKGTNPAFDVVVAMDDQYADGTIGIDLAGTLTDFEGNSLALPVSSAQYTIRNVPGDTNDDGDVVAAELNTVVLWFRDLLP